MLIIVLWGTFTWTAKVKSVCRSYTILLIFENRSNIKNARNWIVCQGYLNISRKIGYGIKFESHSITQRFDVLLSWNHLLKRDFHPFYVILHVYYTFSSALFHLDIFGWPRWRSLPASELPLLYILLHHLNHKLLFFRHLGDIFRIIHHLLCQFEQIRVDLHERPMYFILVFLRYHLCDLQASRLLTAFLTLN